MQQMKMATIVCLVLLVCLGRGALAQSGGGYEVTRCTVMSSQTMSGGSLSLNAVTGQLATSGSSGSRYAMAEGFWGGTRTVYTLYVPILPSR